MDGLKHSSKRLLFGNDIVNDGPKESVGPDCHVCGKGKVEVQLLLLACLQG
jgi:hypothetical protein